MFGHPDFKNTLAGKSGERATNTDGDKEGGRMDIKEKHEVFLYPTVRIFAQKAAGSGTIIYSVPDPESEDHEYITLVLTNHHVVDDSIEYKKDWDSVLKKEIKKEFKKLVKVENFSYIHDSTVDSSNRYDAEIVAYDVNHDLAILRIQSPRRFENVAQLIPRKEIRNLRLFQDVVVSGCSLAHEPFCNFGQITFLKEMIEQKTYLMSNCNSIFGNSGGSLYLVDKQWMIGVPSRITGIQIGFGIDITTWMGFSAHPERIYEFLDEQELRFVYDPDDTYKRALKRREIKERKSRVEQRQKEDDGDTDED